MTLTPKQYFVTTGFLSLLWLSLYVNAHPSWTQTLQESLGLADKLQAADDSFYNSRIDPIFEKYCVACHGIEKDKGNLRLDSYRYLSFSGKSQHDLTLANNNLLIERMSLPETNRLAMPPFGRERHTDSELEIIKLWLNKGGSGTLKESDFPNAPAKAKVISFTDIDWQKIEQDRSMYSKTLKKLQQQYPHVLHYKARTSNLVVLDAFNIRTQFDDALLREFTSLSPVLTEINLRDTLITDAAFDVLPMLLELSTINLSGTAISEARLRELLSLPKLKTLIVDHSIMSEPTMQAFTQQNIRIVTVRKE